MEIKRDLYLGKLIANKHNHLVKIVTGLRRVGKSYLLFNLFKRHLMVEGVAIDHIIEMPFDDYANKPYREAEVFYDYVKSKLVDHGMYYVLLDEVQMLNDFVDVLNGLLHIDNVDVYVTGSNARFLSSDVVTEFRGRGVQVHLNPLSFKEFMSVYEGDSFHGLQEYMQYGGLPIVVNALGGQDKANVLDTLIKETYITDIIARNRIKNDAELEDLFLILASNIGTLTNPTKLANTFVSEKHVPIKGETVKKYIDFFVDAFLIESSQRYDVKGRKYINTPQKYYFADMGLRNALLNFRQIEPTHIMENIIYNELRHRGYGVDIGAVPVYAKNTEGVSQRSMLEIDFVCNRASDRVYIQSAYSMPDMDKLEQEQRSLLSVSDTFRKIIVTADNVPTHQTDYGIEIINIIDFLLS